MSESEPSAIGDGASPPILPPASARRGGLTHSVFVSVFVLVSAVALLTLSVMLYVFARQAMTGTSSAPLPSKLHRVAVVVASMGLSLLSVAGITVALADLVIRYRRRKAASGTEKRA